MASIRNFGWRRHLAPSSSDSSREVRTSLFREESTQRALHTGVRHGLRESVRIRNIPGVKHFLRDVSGDAVADALAVLSIVQAFEDRLTATLLPPEACSELRLLTYADLDSNSSYVFRRFPTRLTGHGSAVPQHEGCGGADYRGAGSHG